MIFPPWHALLGELLFPVVEIDLHGCQRTCKIMTARKQGRRQVISGISLELFIHHIVNANLHFWMKIVGNELILSLPYCWLSPVWEVYPDSECNEECKDVHIYRYEQLGYVGSVSHNTPPITSIQTCKKTLIGIKIESYKYLKLQG